MHIPDGFLNDTTNITTLGAAGVGLAYSARKVYSVVVEKVSVIKARLATFPQTNNTSITIQNGVSQKGREKLWRMATVGSLVFAMQMVNFSITGGTSGHLLGGVLASLILGPFEAMLVISVVLATQAFAFGDGGIIALGANIVNMGIIGAIGGYYVFKLLASIIKDFSMTVAIAAWLSVIMASIGASVEIAVSGTEPFSVVLPAMLTYHVFIGLGEAIITLAIIGLLRKNNLPLAVLEEKKV